MRRILAMVAIITGLVSLAIAHDADASEMAVTLCGDEIVVWELHSDDGVWVIAPHSAMQNSYPLKQFLIEFRNTNPELYIIDMCAEPEEEAVENGWMNREQSS